MNTVPYSKWNCVLANSTKPIYPLPNNLLFTVENYIKSQMHFPLVCYRDGRELDDYLRAMEVIEDNSDNVECLESFYKVLKYFYIDLALCIENSVHEECDSGFNFFVDCELESLPRETFRVDSVQSEFLWRSKVQKLLELSDSSTRPVLIEMR